jgi:hypothetical protein
LHWVRQERLALDYFLRRRIRPYNRDKLPNGALGKALKIHDASLSPKTCVHLRTTQVLLNWAKNGLQTAVAPRARGTGNSLPEGARAVGRCRSPGQVR